jgi:predicted ABC-type transport system involved in lysophospholipase L1 biosynthesis ATPase subunit
MQTLLDLKKITKTFHQGEQRVEVLKSVNLSVKPGEQIAILGQSGTGKIHPAINHGWIRSPRSWDY